MGLSSTTDKQKEAAWRVEFEALGEQLVFKNARQGAIYNDEAGGASLAFRTGPDRPARMVGVFCGDCGGACQHHCFVSGARLSLALTASRLGYELRRARTFAAAKNMHAMRKPTAI